MELLAERQSWRIAVKAKGKIFFLETADIFTVHALGDYASLKHRSSSYLVRESLSSLAVKLKPYGFIRTNRSVLVNTSFVDELWPVSRGEYRLRVRDGEEYTVTRGNKGNLRYLAHLGWDLSAFVVQHRERSECSAVRLNFGNVGTSLP